MPMRDNGHRPGNRMRMPTKDVPNVIIVTKTPNLNLIGHYQDDRGGGGGSGKREN